MKSGRKIYLAVVKHRDAAKRLAAMDEGDLRSLGLFCIHGPLKAEEPCEAVLALCMCEVFRQFMEKGREVL
jgi:hypothetical protein